MLPSDDRRHRLRRRAPYVGVAAFGLLAAGAMDGAWREPAWLGAAGLTLAAGALGVGLLRPFRPHPVLAALVYLLSVAFLRDATGGAGGGMGTLVLLPVIAVALYGTPKGLVAVVAGVAAVFAAPVALVGAQEYPPANLRVGAFMVVFAGMIGLIVQALVSELRRRDVEREQLLTRLARLAHTDSLTGLPNRRAWQEAAMRAISSAQRRRTQLAIAILDLDDFKTINDVHGHLAGDRLLREQASTWQGMVRAHDVLARLGGDEFALLMPDCPIDEAIEVVERLRAATAPGHTCSGGVAAFDADPTPEALLGRADAALYAAKAAGRDCVLVSRNIAASAPR